MTASQQRPLSRESVAVISFGLGFTAAQPPGKRPPGRLAALAAELAARGVLPDLLAALDYELATALQMAIGLDTSRARYG